MAYIVMASTVMAYIVMAYIVMVRSDRRALPRALAAAGVPVSLTDGALGVAGVKPVKLVKK